MLSAEYTNIFLAEFDGQKEQKVASLYANLHCPLM